MAASSKDLQALPPVPGLEPGAILLETDRLILRRLSKSDAAGLAAAGNHTAVAANMSNRFPSPYTVEDAENYLTNICPSPREQGYPVHGGILIKPGQPDNPSSSSSSELRFIGGFGLTPGEDILHRTWTLGYFVTPEVWGKGYMTEAVRAIVRWSFETWPRLNRIEAQTFATNAASGRVLEKCGFIEEARRRQVVEKNGELLDDMIYGILRSDVV